MLQLSEDMLLPVSAPWPDAPGRALHAIDAGSATGGGQPLPLAVLAYSEASGLGRIMRSRLRGLFGAGGAGTAGEGDGRPEPPPGAQTAFTPPHAALLQAMAPEGSEEHTSGLPS